MAGRPYTFTAKRYTFTYTRTRKRFDHEKMDVALIERGNEVSEDDIVYGYVNENVNEGQPLAGIRIRKSRKSTYCAIVSLSGGRHGYRS